MSSNNSDTQQSNKQLRRVPGKLPLSAWLIIISEACERFSYFGVAGPLQNYLQSRPGNEVGSGGLGLSQSTASRINQCFMLWTYITPLAGAIIADQHLGRLTTILWSSPCYALGLLCLFLSSQASPSPWQVPFGLLLLAIFLLGVGSGGIKPNVNAFIAEQYVKGNEVVFDKRSNSYVVVDRDLAIQRIFALFYICINLCSLSPLITTQLEQRLGFAPAFGVPLVVFLAGFGVLLLSRRSLVNIAPRGSVLLKAIKVLYKALQNGGSLAAAKASDSAGASNASDCGWDDAFVDSLASGLKACRLFVIYPIFWACWIQMMTNFISQAYTMETHGLPNDILISIDSLMVIILAPVLEHIVYPYLHMNGYAVTHLSRITLGFLVMGLAMAYTAYIQHLIYSSPPCFDKPRECLAGTTPNQVHIGLQVPSYLLVAIAEILIVPTGYEYTFSRAPAGMKSVIMAVFLSTVAIGAFLAAIISQWATNPLLVWMYTGLCALSFATGLLLWALPWFFQDSARVLVSVEGGHSQQSGDPSESSPLLQDHAPPSHEREYESLPGH